MIVGKRVAVVGSREFKNYAQLSLVLDQYLKYEDEIVSGGALGADSFAQRYAKEKGYVIHIYYPRWEHGKSAGFERNKRIVENSDIVIAFYAKKRFQQGGTANTAMWARKMEKPLYEYEEDVYDSADQMKEVWHENNG
jgi:predicted Rossmann fold nucleotide-binding protein DprA/Smf involved in DNA uptake